MEPPPISIELNFCNRNKNLVRGPDPEKTVTFWGLPEPDLFGYESFQALSSKHDCNINFKNIL
jgi:hypothetical protein